MRIKLLLVVAMVITMSCVSGCATISYKPAVSLPVSAETIKAKVQINTFEDKSPKDDKATKALGVTATALDTISGELGDEVASAILVDFNNGQVFDTIKRKIENPDYILKGTINRFYGKAGYNTFGWMTLPIDLIWIFGFPMQSSEGMVEMTIELYKPDNTLVAKYHGKSEYDENYSIYTRTKFNVPSKLNRCFSDSVRQIREQMLGDIEKLSKN